MERSNVYLEDRVVKPLRAAFADIRAVRNYAVMSTDMQANHGEIVEKIRKIDNDVWKVISSSKQVSRRFQSHVRQVKKKIAPVAPLRSKTKSAARQEAGKVKAASLETWRQECANARTALKQDGYKGSMKVKQGGAVHNKIIELRQAADAGASRSSGAGPAR